MVAGSPAGFPSQWMRSFSSTITTIYSHELLKSHKEPPLLITEYDGEVNATEEGPACPQDADPGYFLDEDCLRLNVYSPGDRNGPSLLPVLVYIHAGGWYSGSGRSDVAGPHYLLDKDLLLVTINYRLGSLGFLSTGDVEAPGNNGFKDQVAALRWVKRNIASFGGDPNIVTIAGYSAGSMSVALHLVSPMSEGLFHRAIAMSGSPYSQVPLKQDLLLLASRQARLMDCPETSTRELVACLRTVPWRKLGDSLRGFRDFSIDPILIWTPVVEGDFGQERFLLEDPMLSMRELRVKPVPFIVSQTRDEFFWEAFLVLNNPIYTSLMNSEWERVSPLAFLLPSPSDRAASVLRDFYLMNRTLSNKTEDARDLGTLYGDGVIGFGVHRLANILSHLYWNSTYRFVFDYIGNRSHYEDPRTGKPVGVAHHDELIYLFSLRVAFEDIPPSGSQDSAMVDKLTTIMYNFALNGDPNPLFGEVAPAWDAFSPHTKMHLSVSQDYSIGRNYSENRYNAWEQLYPFDYSSLVNPYQLRKMWRPIVVCLVLVCANAHDHNHNHDHEGHREHGHRNHAHHNHEHNAHDHVDGRPVVRSPSGEFRGGFNVTRRGRRFETYRGIRYAEPPVGELRFQPPRPIMYYSSPVEAGEDGPACPLPAPPGYPVDEDCLTVNVYTPQSGDRLKPRPVIFFIHAGGFYTMSGRSDLAGPHYLLDRDLVLVTINYRLGSLGFLSTGDALAPGNNGYKDMVAALRWVQRNIRAFGGDPDNVTVAGCSAGSISAILMMVSPMATGLFHRAISMSGSPIGKVPLPTEQRYLAVRQAELLNCPTDSSKAIIDCLKTKPWRDLGDSLLGFYEFGSDPVGIWTAVVEPDFGQERFLATQPDEAIRQGNLYAVPHLISQTQDEFFWMAFTVIRNDTLREQMNREWERVAPISFLLPREKSEAPTRRLRHVYLGDRPLQNDATSAHDLGRLYVDSVESLPIYRMAKLMSKHSPQPVYEYEWAYVGNHSHYEDPDTKKPVGAAHHDELIYLFTLSYRFPAIGLEGFDSKMVDRMTAIWYNFARYGNPNPCRDTPELREVHWPKMTPLDMAYLRIDEDFSLRKDLFKDKVGVWDELYPMQY